MNHLKRTLLERTDWPAARAARRNATIPNRSWVFYILGMLLPIILAGCLTVGAKPTKAIATACATPEAANPAGACDLGTAASTTLPAPQAAGPLAPTRTVNPQPATTAAAEQKPTLPSIKSSAALALTQFPQSAIPCSTLLLARPIAPPANDQVDITYRFGSTQAKKRDPHHGVEFLNPQGTPVFASTDGVVVAAGDDKKTRYSPYFNFYGNLVVIKQDMAVDACPDQATFPLPVYSLYAHLSEVLVQPGEIVHQGQEIGRVGMTGGATGSHLHFEVRLGENTYAAARNPELWLQPKLDETGQPKGALAVQVLDSHGQPIAVQGVVIARLIDGPDSRAVEEFYVDSYEEKALLGNSPWKESFAAGDLPSGWYRITFPYFGVQRQEVHVLPGQVTLDTFQIK